MVRPIAPGGHKTRLDAVTFAPQIQPPVPQLVWLLNSTIIEKAPFALRRDARWQGPVQRTTSTRLVQEWKEAGTGRLNERGLGIGSPCQRLGRTRDRRGPDQSHCCPEFPTSKYQRLGRALSHSLPDIFARVDRYLNDGSKVPFVCRLAAGENCRLGQTLRLCKRQTSRSQLFLVLAKLCKYSSGDTIRSPSPGIPFGDVLRIYVTDPHLAQQFQAYLVPILSLSLGVHPVLLHSQHVL